MLRQLWAACRNPARSLTSSLLRSSQPQRSLPWQQHFFSQSRIPRHGPRTPSDYRQSAKGRQRLQAHIRGTIYVSIAFLIVNDALDWGTRRRIGVEKMHEILYAENTKKMAFKFWATGYALLGMYSGGEVDQDTFYGPADAGWGEREIQGIRMIAPDPDDEGGVLLLCVLMVFPPDEDTYLPEHSRLTDAALVTIPEFEALARGLPESPKVRGGMVLLEETGDWKCLYWDGKRWINLIFIEWQSAESMGFSTVDGKHSWWQTEFERYFRTESKK
ncbi:hypothetical protein F5Y10DRAFT_233582 [Nemania abortiva]|nr:hypothetical protein F5Y10DRAFT_233582 [Nemania abortiva]